MPAGNRGARSCTAWKKLLTLTALSHQSSFDDITEGSNFTQDTVCGYLCTAEPGYDGPTGLGTPSGIGGF
jgi:hypothetical protein